MSLSERQRHIYSLLSVSESFGEQYWAAISQKPYSLETIVQLFEEAEELSKLEGINRTWEGLEFIRTLAVKATFIASKTPGGEECMDQLLERMRRYDRILRKHGKAHKRHVKTVGAVSDTLRLILLEQSGERSIELSFGDVYVKELDGNRRVVTGLQPFPEPHMFLSAKIRHDDRGKEILDIQTADDTCGIIKVGFWEPGKVFEAFERGWDFCVPDEPAEPKVKMFNRLWRESLLGSRKLPVAVRTA